MRSCLLLVACLACIRNSCGTCQSSNLWISCRDLWNDRMICPRSGDTRKNEEMFSKLFSRNSYRKADTTLLAPLIQTFWRWCIKSCSCTTPSVMYSTNMRRIFWALLQVSVVIVPLTSLFMSILETDGMSSSKSGRSGNSREVTSLHRYRRCFNLLSRITTMTKDWLDIAHNK